GKYVASWDDSRAAFQSGQVAMYLDSSAGFRDLIDASKFNVGVSYIPYPADSIQYGVVIGGASLWVTMMGSEETQQGSWDF
ncbi:extracellular solute-binding protein, partial [Bacillus thuringiensis]|uniref:extracellular solute-binding protein n=1 Tax=Bacillus thuringiensis TaxID=1428 RepID=UPI0028452A21